MYYGVLLLRGIGLVLIAYGATEVNPIGLLILLCSVTCGGLNQVIVQSQLQRDGAKYLSAASKKGRGKEPSDSEDAGRKPSESRDGRQLKLNPIVFT